MAQNSKRVKIDGLADAISDSLREYADLTVDILDKVGKEVARKGVKDLKKTSPKGVGSQKGHYADSWAVRSQKPKRSRSSNLIYNKEKPGLTHLLENGHQLRQGGRAKPIPHIEPIGRWCKQEYVRRVEKKLNDG